MIKNTTATTIVAILLFSATYVNAQESHAGSTPIDTVQLRALVDALGINHQEKNCLSRLDRKCLFDYYHTGLPGNPLKGVDYRDSLSWQYMGMRFRDVGAAAREKNPPLFFSLYRRAAVFYFLAGNVLQCNFAIQNLGFQYEEQVHKYDSSLYFVNLALARWQRTKDTLFIANLYKYRAYLSTHIESLKTGIEDAYTAITMYTWKNNQFGVAVSYRDLATVFIKQKQIDSANYYLGKAKVFWKEKRDTSRMFGINADLIKANIDDKIIAGQLITENDGFLETANINRVMLMNYCDAALDYAGKTKNQPLMDRFIRLREQLTSQ
jgi:hypothetical protein